MIELHTMLMSVKKIYECVSTVLSTFFTRYNGNDDYASNFVFSFSSFY